MSIIGSKCSAGAGVEQADGVVGVGAEEGLDGGEGLWLGRAVAEFVHSIRAHGVLLSG